MLHCLNTESDFQKSWLKQIRILCWLIFEKKNTFLIACTKFEKNLIFYNFFILIDKITFQIISLIKLNNKQLNNIHKFFRANSCLIIYKIQKRDENLIFNVIKNKYMHVFFDSEQISIKIFQIALKIFWFRLTLIL